MAYTQAEFALDLPGYEILRELGRGGVSTVYLARHLLLERQVAIKVMSPALAVEEGFNRRFIREGQTIAQLEHPGIVTVYDVAVVNHRPYIAMEYLPGGSLKDRMKTPLSPRKAVSLLRAVADSLGCAHARGIFHRDVKPENILFRENGEPVLTDFGIAKWDSQDTALTSVGIVVGTPRYISPEQAQGEGTDARSDIYALGVILYEMLTGRPPYEAKGSMSLLYAHINDPIPRLPEELSDYQELVDDLMAKDPDQRVADCATLVRRLDLLRKTRRRREGNGEAARPREHAHREKKRRSRWPAVVAAGAVLCVASLILWQQSSRFVTQGEPEPEAGQDLAKMVAKLMPPDTRTSVPAPAPVPSPHRMPPPAFHASPHPEPLPAVPTQPETGVAMAPMDQTAPGAGALSGKDWNYKEGSAPEEDRALRMYGEAAENGMALSQFYLGIAYGNGDGVPRDERRAVYWLGRASDSGVRAAKYNLILGKVFGPSPDTRAAARMALDLAEQKYTPVYRVLGWMYNTGTGVDTSFVQSVRWSMKTMVGDVTGKTGPPGRVVRSWERRLEAELERIRARDTGVSAVNPEVK